MKSSIFSAIILLFGTSLPAAAPPHIIHVLNWHFVPKESFAVDLRDQSDKPISDDEIDRHYEEFLNTVEKVQREQIKLLRELIKKHKLKHIYLEGFSKEELPAFQKRIEVLRDAEKKKPKGDSPIELLILYQLRLDLLEVGASGRLMIDGVIEVLPAEDAVWLEKANPVKDGKVQFNSEINENREDAIVQNLLKSGSVVLVVMGGAHDFSNNVPRECKYERVATKAYWEAVGE
jgi:hypothetical protein